MGIGSGEFRGPTDVAVSKDGYIYVSDWKNHRVQKFRITD
jgi:DNA-binding beta-propeller fold protein YncE